MYMRTKRCIETTGFPFLGICVTCGRKHHINYLDAGHCFSGRTNVKLLNKKFVDIQCRYCNQVEHGKPKKFREIMERRYGKEYVNRQAIRFKKKIIRNNRINWKRRTELYQRKYAELLKSQNCVSV